MSVASLTGPVPMSVHRSRRSRSHKRPRATSGIDLPEVAPVTGLEASPAERLSHVPPQHVPLRYVSGIEAVHVDDGKGELERPSYS